jgi:hypothetical protein
VRFIIIGTIVIIVHFFTLLLFEALVLLMPVFDLAACISTVDVVAQFSVILVSSSAVFLLWSETTCRPRADSTSGQAHDLVPHHHGRVPGLPWFLRTAWPRGTSRVH